jgi:hypothetical protein
MKSVPPRILIIVRVGRRSIHRSWTWTTNGLADLALSTYDEMDCSGDGAQYVHHCPGGKFQGILDFLRGQPGIIDSYDYFWLFEDDLVLPFSSLRKIVNILTYCPFNLSAPSLSTESFFSWPMMMSNESFVFRCTNVVEIMAPIMSKSFLQQAMIAFGDNFSGWGHEWLWSKLLAENGRFAAIFDVGPITHTRPSERGSLYSNCGKAWNPQRDIEQMQEKYKLDRETRFQNFFGVTVDAPHRLALGDEFLKLALSGYSQMQALKNDSFIRCIQNLVHVSLPTIAEVELKQHAGFRIVQDALEKAKVLP